ncbi:MAG: hypothetical protein JWO36_166 [Myxococcales bacterium]|nr:hypothetical protein [Myxococcales bacterium]
MLRVMSDADEVIKNAGRFFTKLGGTLKEAASTAGSTIKQTTKQVTGLGRGDVKLQLDQTRIAPGGTLRGRIVLALSEPVEAKRLVATLRARQKIVTIKKSDGNRSVGTSHADVYHFDLELGGARTYESGTFELELHIPPDALDLRPSAGTHPIADAVRSVASALSPSAGPIEWQVIGKLEISWGRDLSSDVDIVVAR